jgi:hypothetical protein
LKTRDLYYFGAWSKDNLGHFLYAPGGSTSRRHEDELPFDHCILDASLLDRRKPQEEGRYRMVVMSGWTVLTFWDRSADSRLGSNSAFVARGVHHAKDLIDMAREAFPSVFERFKFPLFQEVA